MSSADVTGDPGTAPRISREHSFPREHSFQRWAGIAAVASTPVALASIILPLPAIDYDLGAFADPLALLRRGAQAAGFLRSSLLLDLFGYYLLIAPLVLVLDARLAPRGRQATRLFAGCLLAYVLLGAAGAAVLAGASPRLLIGYTAASAEQRFVIENLYNMLWDSVYGGLWNILEVLMAGVGWLGLGWQLRHERRFAGVVTIVLGVSCLFDAIGNIFGWRMLGESGLYVYLLLAPLWALGVGIRVLRGLATFGRDR